MQMTIKRAETITGGGLTKVTKMPCMTYNLPAKYCPTGAKLRAAGLDQIARIGWTEIICGYCYTFKGQFTFPGVPESQQKRFDTIRDPEWVTAMATLISKQSKDYFRWHSSGDIQDLDHLRGICRVCELTPDTRHWIPTQERKIVSDYLKIHGAFPENLCVRISAVKIGGVAGTFRNDPHRQASMVSQEPVAGAHNCPAPQQEDKCGSCRACWDKSCPLVVYHLH